MHCYCRKRIIAEWGAYVYYSMIDAHTILLSCSVEGRDVFALKISTMISKELTN